MRIGERWDITQNIVIVAIQYKNATGKVRTGIFLCAVKKCDCHQAENPL